MHKLSSRSVATLRLVVASLIGLAVAQPGAAQTQEPTKRPTAPAQNVSLPKGCRWKDQEYRDDVRITTCNAASTIFIRAMPMGPGIRYSVPD